MNETIGKLPGGVWVVSEQCATADEAASLRPPRHVSRQTSLSATKQEKLQIIIPNFTRNHCDIC